MLTNQNNITQEYLKSVLNYNPETGIFIWVLKQFEAGTNCNGYIYISINGKKYLAHRLAWFYMTGKWPKDQIDHKDTIKNNNKWENLREATRQQNGMNKKAQSRNKCGYKGVYWHKIANKWLVRICINKKNKYLGLYDNLEDAAKAYETAAKLAFAEFARI